MNCRKSVCTGSAPSTWDHVLRTVTACGSFAANVGIDGVGGGLALLLGEDGLLFEKRREELVRVLQGAEGEHACGIDFVEDRNFRVEIRVWTVWALPRMEPMVASAVSPRAVRQ